jgi:hypothetical protein
VEGGFAPFAALDIIPLIFMNRKTIKTVWTILVIFVAISMVLTMVAYGF